MPIIVVHGRQGSNGVAEAGLQAADALNAQKQHFNDQLLSILGRNQQAATQLANQKDLANHEDTLLRGRSADAFGRERAAKLEDQATEASNANAYAMTAGQELGRMPPGGFKTQQQAQTWEQHVREAVDKENKANDDANAAQWVLEHLGQGNGGADGGAGAGGAPAGAGAQAPEQGAGFYVQPPSPGSPDQNSPAPLVGQAVAGQTPAAAGRVGGVRGGRPSLAAVQALLTAQHQQRVAEATATWHEQQAQHQADQLSLGYQRLAMLRAKGLAEDSPEVIAAKATQLMIVQEHMDPEHPIDYRTAVAFVQANKAKLVGTLPTNPHIQERSDAHLHEEEIGALQRISTDLITRKAEDRPELAKTIADKYRMKLPVDVNGFPDPAAVGQVLEAMIKDLKKKPATAPKPAQSPQAGSANFIDVDAAIAQLGGEP